MTIGILLEEYNAYEAAALFYFTADSTPSDNLLCKLDDYWQSVRETIEDSCQFTDGHLYKALNALNFWKRCLKASYNSNNNYDKIWPVS